MNVTLSVGKTFVQRTRAREVRTQEFHLVGQDIPALQVDVFGMRGCEGNRE
jgi:hypothetical protein